MRNCDKRKEKKNIQIKLTEHLKRYISNSIVILNETCVNLLEIIYIGIHESEFHENVEHWVTFAIKMNEHCVCLYCTGLYFLQCC